MFGVEPVWLRPLYHAVNSGKRDHGRVSPGRRSDSKPRRLCQLCSPSLPLPELSRRGQCALAFRGRRKPAQACVFYLEYAELSGKFDEEGCSCINVLLAGDLNAVSEQRRRSRDQGDNVQGSSSADHTQIF